ncbi:hypothetical protein T484DRAFT_2084222 [Baffinella frigidus]|nr:hypothetical protein T484DRAFT_2084222 [Cryptophyta sp. CCMP2293]
MISLGPSRLRTVSKSREVKSDRLEHARLAVAPRVTNLTSLGVKSPARDCVPRTVILHGTVSPEHLCCGEGGVSVRHCWHADEYATKEHKSRVRVGSEGVCNNNDNTAGGEIERRALGVGATRVSASHLLIDVASRHTHHLPLNFATHATHTLLSLARPRSLSLSLSLSRSPPLALSLAPALYLSRFRSLSCPHCLSRTRSLSFSHPRLSVARVPEQLENTSGLGFKFKGRRFGVQGFGFRRQV